MIKSHMLMKRLILFLLFFISFNSKAQCEFNFDELLNLLVSNSSEYDTKLVSKGYVFDSLTDIYFCDVYKKPFCLSKRFQEGNFYGFLYTTYSKENYLDIKNRVKEMKFKFSEKFASQNTEGVIYKANDIYITLFIETFEPIPNYNILIQEYSLD